MLTPLTNAANFQLLADERRQRRVRAATRSMARRAAAARECTATSGAPHC